MFSGEMPILAVVLQGVAPAVSAYGSRITDMLSPKPDFYVFPCRTAPFDAHLQQRANAVAVQLAKRVGLQNPFANVVPNNPSHIWARESKCCLRQPVCVEREKVCRLGDPVCNDDSPRQFDCRARHVLDFHASRVEDFLSNSVNNRLPVAELLNQTD